MNHFDEKHKKCLVTGLPVITLQNFTDVIINDGYSISLKKIGESVVYTESKGNFCNYDLDEYNKILDSFCSAVSVKKPYVQIRNLANVTGRPTLKTLKSQAGYFFNSQKAIAGIIIIQEPSWVKPFVEQAYRMFDTHMTYVSASNYEIAINKALEILETKTNEQSDLKSVKANRNEKNILISPAEIEELSNALQLLIPGNKNQSPAKISSDSPLAYLSESLELISRELDSLREREKKVQQEKLLESENARKRLRKLLSKAKKARGKLKEEEKSKHILLNNMHIQIWYLTDASTYGAVNKAYAEFHGLKTEDIAFKNIYDVHHKEVADLYFESNVKVYDTVKPVSYKKVVKNHLGNPRELKITKNPQLNSNGIIKYVVCSAEDITDQIEYEKKLIQSEERFQQMLSLVPDMLSVHDTDMNIVYSNWKGIAAVPEEKRVLGTKCYKTYRGFDDICPDCHAIKVIETKQEFAEQIELPNASWVDLRVIPLKGSNGSVELFLEWVRDITEQKEKEKLLLEAKQQAESANKAKSDFLANMSHEIRTPLNGIIGFTDLLKGTQLSAKQLEYLNYANASGHSLLSVINDILDFSQLQSGKVHLEKRKTDIHKLLYKYIDIAKHAINEKKVKLITVIDHNLPQFAMIDSDRLKQILINLLSNAAKFTHKGKIELIVSYNYISNKNGKALFMVRDTGIGISHTQQEKLFEAFCQKDSSKTRKYGGTGLGLTISDKIAKSMGSKIELESEPEKGSTFYFELAIETDAPVSTSNENQDIDISDESIDVNSKILVVEDDYMNINMVESILAQYVPNATVLKAFNGIQAYECYKSQKPDLILMDVQMPQMDGIEATLEIRNFEKSQQMKSVPIIALTACVLQQEKDKCFAAGMNDFLTKPVNLKRVKALIAQYLSPGDFQVFQVY